MALKKLGSLFGNEHEYREQIFKERYLTKYKKPGGLSLRELEIYCRKCEEYNIQIIGFETLYESQYGLNTYIFEEYIENYEPEWWYQAIADFQVNKITDSIIPFINIPPEVLNKYLIE